MGATDFAKYGVLTSFTVKNISSQNKTIKIFNYPILMNATRDLMKIEGISESDIRSSLVKGELQFRILAQDIIIVDSDIDLLQFNSPQRQFLVDAGITYGHRIDIYNLTYLYQTGVVLIGNADGYNNIFTLPESAIYLQDSPFFIAIYCNGVRQQIGSDFYVSESNGPQTGYDIVTLTVSPSIDDLITADYYTKNS